MMMMMEDEEEEEEEEHGEEDVVLDPRTWISGCRSLAAWRFALLQVVTYAESQRQAEVGVGDVRCWRFDM